MRWGLSVSKAENFKDEALIFDLYDQISHYDGIIVVSVM